MGGCAGGGRVARSLADCLLPGGAPCHLTALQPSDVEVKGTNELWNLKVTDRITRDRCLRFGRGETPAEKDQRDLAPQEDYLSSSAADLGNSYGLAGQRTRGGRT